MIIVYIIVFLCVFTLSLFIFIDILPYIRRKCLHESFLADNLKYEDYLAIVQKASWHMCNTNKTEMILNDERDFISQFALLLNRLKKESVHKEWIYNFPKAFLLIGLSDLCLSRIDLLERLEIISETYLEQYENKILKFDCIMRVPFALFFLNMYTLTKDKKYLIPAKEAYLNLLKWKGNDNIIYYFRNHPHQNLHYVDGLGMYIPFLVKYSTIMNEQFAMRLASANMDYYMMYGVDSNYLPFHNINNGIKLGPNNWGRGIGWFILGLLPLIDFDDKYRHYGEKLYHTLKILEYKPFLWTQFPGASHRIDSSATLPILLLYLKLNSKLSHSENTIILKNLISLTLINGKIGYTSGDTRDINTYSKVFSTSEFSQGLLLTILGKLK